MKAHSAAANGSESAQRLRPLLLVSVRDAAEAGEALVGGADWIDLKEPKRGALGAVDAAAARQVVEFVCDRAPVSAAAGELLDWPHAASRELLDVAGISYLKLGLAGCRGRDWEPLWSKAQREMAAAGKDLVAVAYADDAAAHAPSPMGVLRCAVRGDSSWVLVDTFDKSAGALRDHFFGEELRGYLQSVRAAGRRTVLAGRLDREAIGELPLASVDMVAIRGAACAGGREGEVCRERVSNFLQALQDAGRRAAEVAERSHGARGVVGG